MNIPKRLLHCVSTRTDFSALNHVYVCVDAKQAWATDGRIAICLPIEPEEGDFSGYVPRGAIEAAAKQPKRVRGKLLHGTSVTTVPGVGTWDNPLGEAAFPLAQLQQLCRFHGKCILHVNLALLRKACEALGDTRVSIYYDPCDTEKLLYAESHGGGRVVSVSRSSFTE